MGADYSFYVKTIETHARAFFKVIIFSIGSVPGELVLQGQNFRPTGKHRQVRSSRLTPYLSALDFWSGSLQATKAVNIKFKLGKKI